MIRAAVILLILFTFCWPMRLTGSSMEPTLGDGEIVLMNRFSAMVGRYETGDIVMFRYEDENGSQTVVKRIIAAEGDHIRILENGVEVNGELLEEAYAVGRTYGLADLIVPAGTVYVMGDNRETSYDSRNMGVIAESDLKGKVFFRAYPFSAFGVIS